MAVLETHICVCVCTYRRPDWLARVLHHLFEQETANRFTYSIVVVDNDGEQSARSTVSECAAQTAIPIRYCVEPRQNIAMARNKAVENVDGEFAAFIDDDEFPEKDWLLTLLSDCEKYGVDGVLGPVKRHFDEPPPIWLAKSHFYDRPINPTGAVVQWQEARTGNVLVKKKALDGASTFRPQFRAGEDVDFFRRKIEQGYRFIWSAEAVVYETVPPARWKRSYMLRKALLRGASARQQGGGNAAGFVKSLVAVPMYAIVLPFALLVGHHHFMSALVRMFDHLGKLLALVGINPVKEQYISG